MTVVMLAAGMIVVGSNIFNILLIIGVCALVVGTAWRDRHHPIPAEALR